MSTKSKHVFNKMVANQPSLGYQKFEKTQVILDVLVNNNKIPKSHVKHDENPTSHF